MVMATRAVSKVVPTSLNILEATMPNKEVTIMLQQDSTTGVLSNQPMADNRAMIKAMEAIPAPNSSETFAHSIQRQAKVH